MKRLYIPVILSIIFVTNYYDSKGELLAIDHRLMPTTTTTIPVLPLSSYIKPDISVFPDQHSFTILAGDTLNMITAIVTGLPNETVHLFCTSKLLDGGYNAAISQPDSGNTTVARNFTYISTCEDAAGSPFSLRFTGSSGSLNSTDTVIYDILINVVLPSANLLDTIPNIFTPNGDKKNDFLSLYHIGSDSASTANPRSTNCWNNFHIQVFNRWGELVYENDNINFHWDGTNKSGNAVAEGVYYYIVSGDFQGQTVNKKGTVNVKM